MKGSGVFRGMLVSMAGLWGHVARYWRGTKTYDDPHLGDPYHHLRSRRGTTYRGKTPVPRPLPCDPGTLTYHDKLVAHFGARFANDFRRRYIKSKRTSEPLVLPTDQDFIDNPPWKFLEAQK